MCKYLGKHILNRIFSEDVYWNNLRIQEGGRSRTFVKVPVKNAL
jgi:hypothetical protein